MPLIHSLSGSSPEGVEAVGAMVLELVELGVAAASCGVGHAGEEILGVWGRSELVNRHRECVDLRFQGCDLGVLFHVFGFEPGSDVLEIVAWAFSVFQVRSCLTSDWSSLSKIACSMASAGDTAGTAAGELEAEVPVTFSGDPTRCRWLAGSSTAPLPSDSTALSSSVG